MRQEKKVKPKDVEAQIVDVASCDSFFTTCCIFSAQITSQLSKVYSQKKISFEHLDFLKIIHEEECFIM